MSGFVLRDKINAGRPPFRTAEAQTNIWFQSPNMAIDARNSQ